MPEFCKYHIYGLIMQSLNPAWIHDFGCGVSILGIYNLDGFLNGGIQCDKNGFILKIQIFQTFLDFPDLPNLPDLWDLHNLSDLSRTSCTNFRDLS